MSAEGAKGSEAMGFPSVQVYTGLGSSHSWIWSAQCLEGFGLLRASFVDSGSVLRARPDALVFSGGDGFGMAEELEEAGLDRVRGFVSSGGTYIGICAGAYLALTSSSYPRRSLEMVRAPITNMAVDPPPNIAMPDKYLYDCGGHRVFHPVRGDVLLDMGGGPMAAPMFGGPIWKGVQGGEVVARYQGWGEGAVLLSDEDVARRTLLGKGAVLRVRYGKGSMWLSGPHLEHPGYPDANRLLGDMILEAGVRESPPSAPMEGVLEVVAVRRLLSEARVAYRGLEGTSWTIGRKVWEHEKIGYFVNAMWERVQEPECHGERLFVPATMEMELSGIVRSLRGMRRDVALGHDTTAQAEQLFEALSSCASSFFNHYFEWRLRARLASERRG
ncbi:MAG: BPL-N domain-containing protein [Methanomassiliicoccales archaeon]|nr:BPL-N domain-containing protein [Methanomassiliicoccales archaeon]